MKGWCQLMERKREATTNESPLEHLLNFSINSTHVELLVIYLVLLKIDYLYSKQDVYRFPLRTNQTGHI